jgi:hypothetical protein
LRARGPPGSGTKIGRTPDVAAAEALLPWPHELENQLRTLLSKLSYANVTATVAIFLAMGGAGAMAATHLGRNTVGTAQLKAGAVTGAKVKDASLTGTDVDAASLGKVPAAAHADSATGADHATAAGRADTAARADSAGRADRATVTATAKVAASAPPEAVHHLGEPGEPTLHSGFTVVEPVGFYRDPEGVVHLEGEVLAGSELGGLLAELPVGYRPDQTSVFYKVTAETNSEVYVTVGGYLEIYPGMKNTRVSLAGLSWRADLRTEA